jgi:hypothetical protein
MTTYSETRRLRPMVGLGIASAVLVAAAAIARAVAVTNAGWTRYTVSEGIKNATGMGYAPAIRAIKDSIIGIGLAAIVGLVAGTVFLVWLYRARVNAEVISTWRQRFGRGWTVGAWFVPLANVVLVPMVVGDVFRDSGGRPDGLVGAWWTAVLGAFALDVYGTITGVTTKAAAVAFTIEAGVTLIAGALLIMIIREISRRQR